MLAPSHTRPVGKLSESTFGTHPWDLSVFADCLGCVLHEGTAWSLLCAQHTEQCLLAYSRCLITVCWRFNVCPFLRGVNRDPGSCGNLPHSPTHPQTVEATREPSSRPVTPVPPPPAPCLSHLRRKTDLSIRLGSWPPPGATWALTGASASAGQTCSGS